MNFQKILVPAAGVGALAWAYQLYGQTGVAAAAAGGVMWLLLHFTRMMQVLKRAANQPIGYVNNAGMLNARLKPGMTLLQVVAMTRALGKLQSAKKAQPEVFDWSDDTRSQVRCTFVGGKLTEHALSRLEATDSQAKPA